MEISTEALLLIAMSNPKFQTTANTLCFSLALLALHQEEQEDLYQEVARVYEGNTCPVSSRFSTLGFISTDAFQKYDDVDSLNMCLA